MGKAIVFLVLAMRKDGPTMTFGMMPLAIVFFLHYHPSEWIPIVALTPVYIDYYLEMGLVAKGEITYRGYDKEKAVSVALSYYPTAVLLLFLGRMLLPFFA